MQSILTQSFTGSQAKAEYKAASRAAHKSALADYHLHFTQLLTKVQRSMRKGRHSPSIPGPQAAQQAQVSAWQAAMAWHLWQAASYSSRAHR